MNLRAICSAFLVVDCERFLSYEILYTSHIRTYPHFTHTHTHTHMMQIYSLWK